MALLAFMGNRGTRITDHYLTKWNTHTKKVVHKHWPNPHPTQATEGVCVHWNADHISQAIVLSKKESERFIH